MINTINATVWFIGSSAVISAIALNTWETIDSVVPPADSKLIVIAELYPYLEETISRRVVLSLK